jgi:DNA (cytosine-5)-methyltransferase 1
MNGNHGHFTFLDLFCGCGGFSLGMERAGFRCLAAIDFNPEAVAVPKPFN